MGVYVSLERSQVVLSERPVRKPPGTAQDFFHIFIQEIYINALFNMRNTRRDVRNYYQTSCNTLETQKLQFFK